MEARSARVERFGKVPIGVIARLTQWTSILVSRFRRHGTRIDRPLRAVFFAGVPKQRPAGLAASSCPSLPDLLRPQAGWHLSCCEQACGVYGDSGIPNPKYAANPAADPYFDLVRGALGDSVDGDHFFDIVSDDVVYEVLYEFPGWPRIVQGRANLMTNSRVTGTTWSFSPPTIWLAARRTTVGPSSSSTKSMGPSSRQASSMTIDSVQSSRLKIGRSLTGGTTGLSGGLECIDSADSIAESDPNTAVCSCTGWPFMDPIDQ